MEIFYDMLYSFTIILIFFILIITTYIIGNIEEFKKNWHKHKCNPMAMPFASMLGYDTMKNFTGCISTIQTGLMTKFTDPIFKNMDILSKVGKNLNFNINFSLAKLAKLDKLMGMLSLDIFSIFNAILYKFQYMMIKMQDLFGKLMGTMIVMVRMVEALPHTGRSLQNGPVGKVMGKVFCFDPMTKVKLNNGKFKYMKDIQIGDILEHDIEVEGTLKLKGNENNPYYKIWSNKLNDYIYVTGEHRILKDSNTVDKFENYIFVKDHQYAHLTDKYDLELSCLITSSNRIPIGEYIFWDWED